MSNSRRSHHVDTRKQNITNNKQNKLSSDDKFIMDRTCDSLFMRLLIAQWGDNIIFIYTHFRTMKIGT